MIQLSTVNNDIKLYYKERCVFTHTKDAPFAEAIIWDVKFKSSRGHFSIKNKIKKRIPLANAEIVLNSENKKIIKLFQDDIALTMDIIQENGYLKCNLQGSEGSSYRFNFDAIKNEGIFGGGEQYRQLDLKGEKVVNFVSEHIVVKPIVQKTIFKFLPYKEKANKDIASYSPMSTFVSSEKYAIRFNTNTYGVQDFSLEAISAFTYDKCPDSFIYVVEKSYKEINYRLNTDIPNKQYLPSWAFDGMILGVQGGIDRAVEKAEKMVKAGAKVCGVWCQDWCGKKVTAVGKQVLWNWEVDEVRYKDLKNRIAILKEKGVHFLAYINPYLVKDGKLFNYCKEKGYLVKKPDGSVAIELSTTFEFAMMDLTNKDMVKFLKETIIKKNMLDLGIDGYMADFGECLPLDSVLSEGDGKSMHNYWPTLWARINREAIDSHPRGKEVFFFTRSGYNGAQMYTPVMWNGDQHTDYSKDYGMPCVMPATFNLGFSGLPLIHSDIGGFISFASLKRDAELFIRWMEMNTFSPLMRSHETIRPENNAQYDDELVIEHTARLTTLHSQLKPYLLECLEQAKQGIPFIRPDFYNSGDYAKHKDLYSYFLGDEIFVSPIIEKGVKTKKICLPEGIWIRFFDDKEYKGNTEYNFDVPLGMPLAFYLKDGMNYEMLKKIKINKIGGINE